jgi:hypothetical protein
VKGFLSSFEIEEMGEDEEVGGENILEHVQAGHVDQLMLSQHGFLDPDEHYNQHAK